MRGLRGEAKLVRALIIPADVGESHPAGRVADRRLREFPTAAEVTVALARGLRANDLLDPHNIVLMHPMDLVRNSRGLD